MRKIISISIDDATPSIKAVLNGLGVPQSVAPDERIIKLAQKSISIYRDIAKPAAVIMEISTIDFENVYHGEGDNEPETPLENIYKSADNLALFTVTVGENVSLEITRLFKRDEFAIGSMLDSAASESAEMTAQVAESFYDNYLKETNRQNPDSGVMRFSPGYCGWHISAQKKLFEFLDPGKIGIELGDSFLMTPLKSISGVIVNGSRKIFEFEDTFPFCSDCDTHSCRDRIKEVLE